MTIHVFVKMIKMNMKQLLTLFFALSVAFLVSSCATTNPNQQKLIGSWKAVKVEKFNTPDTLYGTSASIKTSDSTTGGYTESQRAALQSGKVVEQEKRVIIRSELNTVLTLNADKTATKEFQGKTIPATWKLKKNGTRLLVASKETDKNMILEIQRISDTSAIMVQSLPIGDFKITYKKGKK